MRVPSAYYWADRSFAAKSVSVAADRYKITTPAAMRYDLGGTAYDITAAQTLDLSDYSHWDHGTPTTWTAGHSYSVGDWVKPTGDGSKNGGTTDFVPLMTSNTAPFPFVASASSAADATRVAYKLFNDSVASDNDGWRSLDVAPPYWVKLYCGTPVIINKFRIGIAEGSHKPVDFQLQGSNNDTDWSTIYSIEGWVGPPGGAYSAWITFTNSTPYLYYRLYITKTTSGTACKVGEIEFIVSHLIYRCTTAGVSDATEPTWSQTYGATVNDGTAVWTAYYDNTLAINRAGQNFYAYAVPTGFKLSRNSTVPHGYTADNSRKLGGFHCLCLSAGTISGHTLTGYLTGDILPASVWDLKHRPHSNAEGMVYSELADMWVDIYLPSGTGVSTASVYNATISDNRAWLDFADDGAAVKKQFLTDGQFQIVAEGSNQKTNISGSADPVTTGAHVDTAARRMLSNIGCEDCCGAMYQFLADQHMNWDLATSTSLGSELLTNSSFTTDLSSWTVGANWAWQTGGYARHTAGSVETLTQAINLTAGKWYKVVLITANRTAGSVSVAVGATTTHSAIVANTTTYKDYICPTTASTTITITPSTDFDGDINSLSIKEITFGWLALAGNKGSLYAMGAIADGKMIGGGGWNTATDSGSRSRYLQLTKSSNSSTITSTRFCSKPINK